MSAAQPARSVAADLAAWVLDAGRAVGESTIVGRVLHGPDGEVETVVDDQAVRLGRRRERRKHLAGVEAVTRAARLFVHVKLVLVRLP